MRQTSGRQTQRGPARRVAQKVIHLDTEDDENSNASSDDGSSTTEAATETYVEMRRIEAASMPLTSTKVLTAQVYMSSKTCMMAVSLVPKDGQIQRREREGKTNRGPQKTFKHQFSWPLAAPEVEPMTFSKDRE